MAISNKAIPELYEVIESYVSSKKLLRQMLHDLSKTTAYKANKSFRDTIDRLMTEFESREEG